MKCTNFKHILALLTYDLKSPVFEQEALKKWKMEPGHPVDQNIYMTLFVYLKVHNIDFSNLLYFSQCLAKSPWENNNFKGIDTNNLRRPQPLTYIRPHRKKTCPLTWGQLPPLQKRKGPFRQLPLTCQLRDVGHPLVRPNPNLIWGRLWPLMRTVALKKIWKGRKIDDEVVATIGGNENWFHEIFSNYK